MSLLSPHANPTERRRLTLRYHGSKIFGSQQDHNDGDGNENGEESKRLNLAKQQPRTSITLFCTFLSPASLNDSDMKRSYFTRPLYGVREHNTKCSFSFFFQPQNFATI